MKTNNQTEQQFLQAEPIEVHEADLIDVVGGRPAETKLNTYYLACCDF